LWSKAAYEAAGGHLPALQDRLFAEIGEMLADGSVLLAHILRGPDQPAVYFCTGQQTHDHRLIFVQLARDPPRTSNQQTTADTIWVPEPVDGEDNTVFAAYEDLIA